MSGRRTSGSSRPSLGVQVLIFLSFIFQGKSQFEKCLGEHLEVPDILLADIRGLLTDFLGFIAFCRCGTGVALHPLKILVSHLPPPHSQEVSHRNLGLKRCRATRGCRRYLRVSRCTVQLMGARQRSGEGVVRRNGCPKRVFLESPFLLCSLKVFRTFQVF